MVYVFLANGFEDIEGLAPVDILRRRRTMCANQNNDVSDDVGS